MILKGLNDTLCNVKTTFSRKSNMLYTYIKYLCSEYAKRLKLLNPKIYF